VDSPLIAVLGAALGVAATLLLRFLGKRKQVVTPPAPPTDTAKAVAAEVHAEAAKQVDAKLEDEKAEVKVAAAASKPGSALAAILNRKRK
jgi:hypothetical protein